jgi:hypothetical protein
LDPELKRKKLEPDGRSPLSLSDIEEVIKSFYQVSIFPPLHDSQTRRSDQACGVHALILLHVIFTCKSSYSGAHATEYVWSGLELETSSFRYHVGRPSSANPTIKHR